MKELKSSILKLCFLMGLVNCFFTSKLFAQSTTKGATIASVADNDKKGNTWAVIVGISKYQNVQGLNYADKDALAFYDYLVNKKGLDSKHVQLLINEKAIASDIYGALEWLNLSVQPNDRVIFYFSGHGDVETKTIYQDGFLLASDAPTAAYMTKGTISIIYLQHYLETYVSKKAKDVLLIVDACRSGKLAGGSEGLQVTMHALGQNWNNQIIKVLSAQEGESSFEDKKWGGGRGVFSYYLVKGLEGLANRNADSVITASELAAYLPFAVADATGSVQNPTVTGSPKTNLFTFNKTLLALANLQDNKNETGQLLASRGTNDELDPEIEKWYGQYRSYLQKGRLIWGDTETDTLNCAKYYYLKLLNDARAKKLQPSLKSSFVASLKHKTEIKLDDYIKGNGFYDPKSEAYKEMLYAKTQIDSSYILYNYFSARLLFMECFKTWDPLKGISLLKKVIRIEPDAAYAYNLLGKGYSRLLSIGDSALYYYNKAISLSPTWAWTFDQIAQYYIDIKDYKTALIYQKKALKIDSLDMDIYEQLHLIYVELQESKKADSTYILAEKIVKNEVAKNMLDADAYLHLADFYLLRNDNSTAEKNIKLALNIDKNKFEGYLWLSNIYINERKFNLAIDCYSFMLKLQPDQSASILEDIGKAYEGLKNYDKAIEFYNKAIEYYKKEISVDIYFGSAYRRLSNIYLLKNDTQSAINTCDSAISVLGRYPEVSNIRLSYNYYAFGKIYKQIGDTLKEKACYKKAETNFKTLIKNNSQINEFYEELGGFYLDIKDYSNAEKICQIVIANHPEMAESYYEMACIYSNEKNINKSLEYFKISLEKGYNDYNNISVDTDLTNIRQLPEFKELLKIYFPDKVK